MVVSVPSIIPAPAGAARPRAGSISFLARRAEFRRLVLRGALLELCTAGFYRFWLATDMRRHLWSHTALDGDTLEYTGTARELLLGFLFAVAILAPIYLLYFLAGLEAERLKHFASVPMGLFFYLFFQFAIYRARRYRLTRTVWRGVRFWMTGSGWAYAMRVGLWAILVSLTLGIALPWRQAALERYKMRHTSYGELRSEFIGKGSEFFKRAWGLWFALWLMLIVPGILSIAVPFVALVYFFEPFALPFVYAMYKAIEWRWWVSGIRFGEVTFESNLNRGDLVGLYWKMAGWFVLIFVAMALWMSMVSGIGLVLSGVHGTAAQKSIAIFQQVPVLVGIGFGYVAAILAFWAVARIYLVHDVWQRIAASTAANGIGATDDVQAQGDVAGALGEGFADSLDVVGF
jgi:uncharacterized membrane protein YjgN (DUF898 family)